MGAGTVQQAHCSHLSEIAVKLLTLYDRKMDKVREKEMMYIYIYIYIKVETLIILIFFQRVFRVRFTWLWTASPQSGDGLLRSTLIQLMCKCADKVLYILNILECRFFSKKESTFCPGVADVFEAGFVLT